MRGEAKNNSFIRLHLAYLEPNKDEPQIALVERRPSAVRRRDVSPRCSASHLPGHARGRSLYGRLDLSIFSAGAGLEEGRWFGRSVRCALHWWAGEP
jgi:hypothetical protein